MYTVFTLLKSNKLQSSQYRDQETNGILHKITEGKVREQMMNHKGQHKQTSARIHRTYSVPLQMNYFVDISWSAIMFSRR